MYSFGLLFSIAWIFSCTPQTTLNTTKAQPKVADSTYQQGHTLEDCQMRIGFSKNTSTRSWMYTGRGWKYAKSSLKSLEEAMDSMLVRADYDAMFEVINSRGGKQQNLECGNRRCHFCQKQIEGQ